MPIPYKFTKTGKAIERDIGISMLANLYAIRDHVFGSESMTAECPQPGTLEDMPPAESKLKKGSDM